MTTCICILFELVCYLGYWYILYVTLLYCCYLIQYKQTPVWIAACNGRFGALNVLVSAKADVNVADLVSFIFNLYNVHEIILWYNNIIQSTLLFTGQKASMHLM